MLIHLIILYLKSPRGALKVYSYIALNLITGKITLILTISE